MLNAEPMASRGRGRPPAGNKLKKPVSIRLTDSDYEALYAFSKLRDKDITTVIRDAIRDAIAATQQ